MRLRTALEPAELLHRLKEAEHHLGRRPTIRHGARVIDLDILLYDEWQVATAELEVPHPRMMQRAFVLRPLLELQPALRHPTTGERIADRLDHGPFERTVPLFPGSELIPVRERPDAANS